MLSKKLKSWWKNTRLVYGALFVICAIGFFGHFAAIGHAIYGDGIGYWSHLHTFWLDRDLDYTNEFRHWYDPKHNNCCPEAEAEIPLKTFITKTGKTGNIHQPGVALFTMPAYVLADAGVILLNSFGAVLERNGYSNLYQFFVGLSLIGYTVLGTFLLEKCVRLFGFAWSTARTVVLGFFFASPLLYYGAVDVINSHGLSVFLNALIFYLLFRKKSHSIKEFGMIGILIGLATIVRLQDGLLVLLVAGYVFIRDKGKLLEKIRSSFVPVLTTGLFSLITITPMLYQWKLMYGQPFQSAYLQTFIFQGWWGSLFDIDRGLFIRTPIISIALLGINFLKKKFSGRAILLSLYFLAHHLVIVLYGGWVGAAYGGRMYLSLAPIFVILLAYIYEAYQKRTKVNLIFILLSAINGLSIVQLLIKK